MGRYNRSTTRAQARSIIATDSVPSGWTHEGAPGYERTPESELFLLAVTHMGDGSFYESAPQRDQRFRDLVHKVAKAGPEWMAGFIPWLRLEANMRTASVVAAAETAKALLDAQKPGGRPVVASALQRADEPGELLAYWHSRYGRTLPKPVKRGIADAAARLYDEYALLKYDTASHGYRFADIIDLTHPSPAAPWQGDLFEHALDRRHGRGADIPGSLPMISANAELRARAAADPRALLDPRALKSAGMTWEDVLSLAGDSLPKKELWTALIPSMGIFALVRNLRNFDEAGLPDEIAAQVAEKLTSPEVIARSRMFPFRFLAAYRAAPSLRWAYPLEQALSLSLANVPMLPGRTLILVDRSGSMFDKVSAKSGLNRADTAALFGTALAVRSEHADLAEFGTTSGLIKFSATESMLKVIGRFSNRGGTNTADAVRHNLRPKFHNRVVILTDEQAWAGHRGASPLDCIPPDIPAYTWNLAGYRYGHGPSGGENRHAFGGLSDASFRVIPALEAGRDVKWGELWKSAMTGSR